MIDDRYSSFNAVGKNMFHLRFILRSVSFFIISTSLVQSVADNETDVTVPGYFITEKRYKIVDYTVPFFSQGFYFWIKSSSVSIKKSSVKLFYPILYFQGIRIIMVFISVANVL